MTNEDRIGKAEHILECFYDELEPAPTDLLADLMHYCHENKIDFENHLRIARGHFEAEQS